MLNVRVDVIDLVVGFFVRDLMRSDDSVDDYMNDLDLEELGDGVIEELDLSYDEVRFIDYNIDVIYQMIIVRANEAFTHLVR